MMSIKKVRRTSITDLLLQKNKKRKTNISCDHFLLDFFKKSIISLTSLLYLLHYFMSILFSNKFL